MEDTEIKKLLQVQHGQSGRRGWRCPDEIQLAAYVAQRLSSRRNSIEAHVADCDFCLSQVAFLTQSADWTITDEVPSHLLTRARKLVTREPGKSIKWGGWRWAATAAAVACFALLFVVIALQVRRQESVSRPGDTLVAQQTSPEPVASPQTSVASTAARPEPNQPVQTPKAKSTETPMVRSNTAGDLLPKLITPRDGAVIRREDLEFRWEPVSEAIFYDVRILSAEGNLVFEAKTEDTSLKPGPTAPLVPGTKYFLVTRAHLRQGKTAKSSVVSFRLAE